MNRFAKIAILVVLGVGGYVASSAVYTVSEVEQMIITQFGKPVGEAMTYSPMIDGGIGCGNSNPFIPVRPVSIGGIRWFI